MQSVRGELQRDNITLLGMSVLTAVVLFAVSYVTLTFSRFEDFYTTVWFGNALALIACSAAPKKQRWIVGLAALLGVAVAGALVGDPPVRRACLLAADIVEWYILVRAADEVDVATGFANMAVFVRFLVRGALAGPLVSAAMAVALLAAAHKAVHPVLPLSWYASDVLGILLVYPMWLGVRMPIKRAFALLARLPEAAGIYVFVALTCYVTFFAVRLPLKFCVIPLPIIAAFRLGLAGTMGTLYVVTACSIYGTMTGKGTLSAFSDTFPNERIGILQAFLLVSTVLTLIVHVMLSERNSYFERLQAAALRRRKQSEDRVFVGETSTHLQKIFDRTEILRCAVRRIAARYSCDCAAFFEIDGQLFQAATSGSLAGDVPDHHPFPLRRIARDMFLRPEKLGDTIPTDPQHLFAVLSIERKAVGLLSITLPAPAVDPAPTQHMLDEMASVVSAGLDTAEFFERDRTVVKALQRELLPPFVQQFPGVAVDAVYVPPHGAFEIGGDWYDVGPLSDGRIYFSIGDVCGHGIPAAGLMGKLRATMKSIVYMTNDIESALRQMDFFIREYDAPTVTVCCGILDPEAHTLTYVSAGHPPLLIAYDNVVEALDGERTLPLGLIDDLPIPVHTIDLPPGTMIVGYTDGLLEADRDVVAAEIRLAAAVRRIYGRPEITAPAEALRRAMLDKNTPSDDTAIMTISVAPIEADYRVRLRLTPTNARALRRRTRLFAERHGLHLPNLRQLDISIGEALINVIEHAYDGKVGDIDFRCRRDRDTLIIGITDFGVWRPERDEGRGHGMTIMRDFCDRTIVSRDESGTTVEFRIPLDVAAVH